MSRLKTALCIATAGLASSAAVPTAAPAATNPYSGPGVCGSGFTFARSWPVRSNDGKVLLGELVLSYGPGARPGAKYRTCAVLLKRRAVGSKAFMSVRISKRVSGQPRWRDDDGNFGYYAGPIYVSATPACTNVGGFIAVPGGREGINVQMSSYNVRYC